MENAFNQVRNSFTYGSFSLLELLFFLVVLGRMDKENAVPLSLQCYEKANHCSDRLIILDLLFKYSWLTIFKTVKTKPELYIIGE